MDTPGRHFAGSRYDYARAKLSSLGRAGVVFDVGCGEGPMRDVEAMGYEWRGFDRGEAEGVKAWNLDEPAPESGARIVLLLDVIEHSWNPGVAMTHIARALVKGGHLVLTVPNPRWSASRIHALVFGDLSAFRPWDLDHNHHVFTPWQHVMARLLDDAGFVVEEYVTLDQRTRPFRHPLSLKYPLQCISDVGRLAIEAADPSSRGMSYGLLARKVREPGPARYFAG